MRPMPAVLVLAAAASARQWPCAAVRSALVPALSPPRQPHRPKSCADVGFVHCPKCGGTSMLASLATCCAALSIKRHRKPRSSDETMLYFHGSAERQRRFVGPSVWDRAYTFAIVRNPWARQVSDFYFMTYGECRNRHRRIETCSARHWPPHPPEGQHLGPADFMAWIRLLFAKYPPGSAKAFRFSWPALGNDVLPGFGPSQMSYITSASRMLLVKAIYKLEELEEHWGTLQRHICGLETVSYANHSSRGRGLCAGMGSCRRGQPPAVGSYRRFYDNETRHILAEYMAPDIQCFGYQFD
eukprot:TRINITY_DN4061_c0_g1_i2.p1 TRINITY_DN4061_c0_g1~~TRINITY_DN4061_c0_g1_i2.p1  ORF type:complete len:299 (+),score=23.36 TRINITY_DN4061_c0_g1_i2:82-978(+)